MKQFLILCALCYSAFAASWTFDESLETKDQKDVGIFQTYEIVNQAKTWSQARDECAYKNKRLTVIERDSEIDDVLIRMADLGVREAWTGGHGDRSGEKYVWSTDTNQEIELLVNPLCVDTFELGVKIGRNNLTGVHQTTKLAFVCEVIN